MIRFLSFLSLGNAFEVFFNVSTNGLNQIGVGTWSLFYDQKTLTPGPGLPTGDSPDYSLNAIAWPQAMTPNKSNYIEQKRPQQQTIHMSVLILIGGLIKNVIMGIAVGLVMELINWTLTTKFFNRLQLLFPKINMACCALAGVFKIISGLITHQSLRPRK